MRRSILCVLILLAGCAKAPPSLSPTGARLFQADQAVVALGTVFHAASELNKVQACQPAPCHPLLADANVRIVADAVEPAVRTLRATPDGWRATLQAALAQIQQRLDAGGRQQLGAWIQAASAMLTLAP